MSLGDRLDAAVARLVACQKQYAITIANACTIAFVANCAAFGFAAVAAPAAAGHFLYGGAMFLTGAVANYLLGRSRR